MSSSKSLFACSSAIYLPCYFNSGFAGSEGTSNVILLDGETIDNYT